MIEIIKNLFKRSEQDQDDYETRRTALLLTIAQARMRASDLQRRTAEIDTIGRNRSMFSKTYIEPASAGAPPPSFDAVRKSTASELAQTQRKLTASEQELTDLENGRAAALAVERRKAILWDSGKLQREIANRETDLGPYAKADQDLHAMKARHAELSAELDQIDADSTKAIELRRQIEAEIVELKTAATEFAEDLMTARTSYLKMHRVVTRLRAHQPIANNGLEHAIPSVPETLTALARGSTFGFDDIFALTPRARVDRWVKLALSHRIAVPGAQQSKAS